LGVRNVVSPILVAAWLAVAALPSLSWAQTAPDPGAEAGHKRILGIIPNYRTSPPLTDYQPLSVKDKFKVAAQDAADPGTFVLAGLFAAQAQWTAATPAFGTGVPAYFRYYAASATDFIVGDFMTEAIYPAMLRQDPRYFRKGTGGGWARFGYAVSQIVRTRADSGNMQVNVSEIAGNATAVAISNAYYPDNRSARSNAAKLGIQLGVDAISNVLKEFSPDLDRLFSHKKR
jgi:hypothetical protein